MKTELTSWDTAMRVRDDLHWRLQSKLDVEEVATVLRALDDRFRVTIEPRRAP